MYRYSNGQISLSDFKQPVGMNLKESNRWVKKAQTIPWPEIEKRYAALFTNRKGNVAKPLRLALGACIIQAEYGYSDEEIALQIQENPYLQYFCGYAGYDDSKLPFDPSLMVYFRKRLTPEVLGEINEMILQDVAKAKDKKDNNDDDDDGSGNSGTLTIDATCAPSNIRYPQDVSLLNEEGIRSMQAFVALTDNAETNILACLTAKRMGVRKTVAMVENIDYVDMAESLDIGTIINKKVIAASHIYQMMLDANVHNVKFLTTANADVAEFVPVQGSKITLKPVKDLNIPRGMTIGGIVRGNEGMLVSGNTLIEPGDSVVVFCHQVDMKKIERMFN